MICVILAVFITKKKFCDLLFKGPESQLILDFLEQLYQL